MSCTDLRLAITMFTCKSKQEFGSWLNFRGSNFNCSYWSLVPQRATGTHRLQCVVPVRPSAATRPGSCRERISSSSNCGHQEALAVLVKHGSQLSSVLVVGPSVQAIPAAITGQLWPVPIESFHVAPWSLCTSGLCPRLCTLFRQTSEGYNFKTFG